MKKIERNIKNTEMIESSVSTLDSMPYATMDDWDTLPLPARKEVANFYDGNNCRIVYQKSASAYAMLTFTMEEGCNVYWGSSNYGYWYFTDKTKASNFLFYELTKDEIGQPSTVTWMSSSSNYIASTTKTYKRNTDNVLFSNVAIHDKDATTVLLDAMPFTELYHSYVHLKSVSFGEDVRIKPNQSWKHLLDIDYVVSEKSEVREIIYSGEYQEVYTEVGSYRVGVQVVLEDAEEIVSSVVEVLVNVYDDGLISFPNDIPFPPQDGMKHMVVAKTKTGVELLTFTATRNVRLYTYSATSIRFFNGDTTMAVEDRNSAIAGSYHYTLQNGKWVNDESRDEYTRAFPSYTFTVTGVEDVLFSTCDIHSTKSTLVGNLIREKDAPPYREDFSIKNRKYDVPYELPSVKEILEADNAHHYFINYHSSYVVLTTMTLESDEQLSDFFLEVRANSSSAITPVPSVKLKSVSYRRYDSTTGEWGTPTTATGASSFSTTYVHSSSTSTLTKAKVLNDMFIYTTAPIILTNYNDEEDRVIARQPDNRLVADENSVKPNVIDIIVNASTEGEYTVDTDFTFGCEYQLENIEGIALTAIEWKNKLTHYPIGNNIVSVRVQDNRGLWSDWFDKQLYINPPVIPDGVPISEFPLQENGEPFEHYIVYKSVGASGYTYFGFTFNEGVEEELSPRFYLSLVNGSNYQLRCNQLPSVLKEYAVYGLYENGEWKDKSDISSTSSSLLGNYFYPNRYVNGSNRSSIYYTTYPIYLKEADEETHVYPSPKPSFPVTIGAICSHEDEWTTDDVMVTVQVNGNGQEWQGLKYRVNGGDDIPLRTDGDLIFSSSGIYHIEFFVYNMDNVESKASVSFRIDKDKPTIQVADGVGYFTLYAADDHSGLQEFKYRLVGTEEWTIIKTGHRIFKPSYGGLYQYEIVATDILGNSETMVYDYDVPKIPITDIQVIPDSLELGFNQSQQLRVVINPQDHNEEYTVVYESLSPYVTVTEAGKVTNNNGYYTGDASVKVTVNQHEVIVPVYCDAGKLEYPSDYPSLFDIHNIEGDFTDFIVYRQTSSTYALLALKLNEGEETFYLKDNYNSYLCFTTEGVVESASRFYKLDDDAWERQGVNVTVYSDYIAGSVYSKYPAQTIAFSTLDIYSDADKTILAYPKDVLPTTNKAKVWIDDKGQNGQTLASANWTIHAEETGSGLVRLAYSINGGDEIEITNGGEVSFTENGVYELQAFAYNNDNVRSQTDVYRVEIVASLPSDFKVKINGVMETLQLSLQPTPVRYYQNGEWKSLKVVPSSTLDESERQVQFKVNGEWYTAFVYHRLGE